MHANERYWVHAKSHISWFYKTTDAIYTCACIQLVYVLKSTWLDSVHVIWRAHFVFQLSLWDRVLYPHHQHRLRPSQLLLGGLRHACKTKFIHKWIIRFNVWQHACMHIYIYMHVCVCPDSIDWLHTSWPQDTQQLRAFYSTKFGTCDTECSNARSDSANDLCCHLLFWFWGSWLTPTIQHACTYIVFANPMALIVTALQWNWYNLYIFKYGIHIYTCSELKLDMHPCIFKKRLEPSYPVVGSAACFVSGFGTATAVSPETLWTSCSCSLVICKRRWLKRM